jgi:hypothetical protein
LKKANGANLIKVRIGEEISALAFTLLRPSLKLSMGVGGVNTMQDRYYPI